MPGRYDKGSPPTKEGFTGHVKDGETGLHYAGARYYSGAFGRWTTTDPILGEKGAKKLLKDVPRLLTMTSYNYAFDNPVRLRDPTGMAPCPPCNPVQMAMNRGQQLWQQTVGRAANAAQEAGEAVAEGAREAGQATAEATETAVKEGPDALDKVAAGATVVAAASGTAAAIPGPDSPASAAIATGSAKVAAGAEVTAAVLSAIDAAAYGGSVKEAKFRTAVVISMTVGAGLPAKSLNQAVKGAPGISKSAREGAEAAIETSTGAAMKKSVEQASDCDEPDCR